MTVSRVLLVVLAVGVLAVGLKALHHAAPKQAPGVTGLTNAIHAAHAVVQQSQETPPVTPAP
jgi:hypothetical protein